MDCNWSPGIDSEMVSPFAVMVGRVPKFQCALQTELCCQEFIVL
jgi:hypothetical protein